MDIGSDVSFSLSDAGSKDFRENFASGHIPAANVAPKPQAILHSNPVPDLNTGFSYHHANLGTDLHHAPFQTGGTLVSSPSSGSTEGDFVSNGRQPLNPVVIYRPQRGRVQVTDDPNVLVPLTFKGYGLTKKISTSLQTAVHQQTTYFTTVVT
ncbi:hypothetical protein OG21DRAFT_1528042 [Imleria badia]|nr:hypothetical protein OG21DRAFT_1528042 [Imleria badia]